MIVIDYKDGRPIYEQIVDRFKTMIFKGVLKPDEQMPSIRNLAVELSINPNTIQKAYAKLEQEGFLYSIKGRGNFVAFDDTLLLKKKEDVMEKFRELVKEAIEVGITREELIEIISQETEK